MVSQEKDRLIEQILQDANGKILGYLVRICGSFDDAEDIRQDVMVSALDHWTTNNLPDNPLAYLLTMARNRAADRFRQTSTRERVHDFLVDHNDNSAALQEETLEDDLLRLIFTCCHPALAEDVRVPLTLKSVTGLGMDEVARAFLVPVKTMEQRLLRGKRKIQQAGISYEVPEGADLEERLGSVMQTLYLLFNEGYTATSGENLIREELCREAIRLTTIVQRLFPERAELIALLSLMLFQDSRRQTRVSPDGDLILLQDQDRSKWNIRSIQRASALLHKALYLHQQPGVYQLQAAIAALHAESPNADSTDWPQIALLYRRLVEMSYTEVIHLNYAVALVLSGNPAQALLELNQIEEPLKHYFPFYCARADCHRRIGNKQLCKQDFETAAQLTQNKAEQRFIQSQLAVLTQA